MEYFLLAVSLCLLVSKNLLSKGGRDVFAGTRNLMLSNLIVGAVAMAIFAVRGLIFSAFGNPLFLILSFLYGLMTLGSQSLYILAVQNGSLSVCSLIYSSSFLFPTVFSMVVFQEPMPWNKGLGIGLIVLAILLVSLQKKSGDRQMSGKAWFFIFSSMLCAGTVGILQRVTGRLWSTENQTEFLFAAFAFLFLSSGIILCIAGKGDKTLPVRNKRFWLFGIAMAISVTFANRLNVYLGSGVLPGVIFFPVLNGGCILLSSLFSCLFFGEKLKLRQASGIVVGLCGIVLMAL